MKNASESLSRRERQIMDIIYARGQASAREVHENLPDRPSYSSVRTLLGILERKGHLKHKIDGEKYIYLPTRSRNQAGQSALRRLVDTFFEGSATQAVAALLQASDATRKPEELEQIAKLIDEARKEGR